MFHGFRLWGLGLRYDVEFRVSGLREIVGDVLFKAT